MHRATAHEALSLRQKKRKASPTSAARDGLSKNKKVPKVHRAAVPTALSLRFKKATTPPADSNYDTDSSEVTVVPENDTNGSARDDTCGSDEEAAESDGESEKSWSGIEDNEEEEPISAADNKPLTMRDYIDILKLKALSKHKTKWGNEWEGDEWGEDSDEEVEEGGDQYLTSEVGDSLISVPYGNQTITTPHTSFKATRLNEIRAACGLPAEDYLDKEKQPRYKTESEWGWPKQAIHWKIDLINAVADLAADCPDPVRANRLLWAKMKKNKKIFGLDRAVQPAEVRAVVSQLQMEKEQKLARVSSLLQ
ncbi:hypothetical protein CB0940_08148 [Cercospora beticola]|uniref:Uncharacterized protein n=1 Tax=Cercospora beticola TaxID=122368 RepID=A0A2G5HPU7_CERBT|nr:hypothetical protein CB0940_08148 [Cercospora beticola]PIA94548.1 hypothetical protein CB0940_08148 [Cercospora beticola]WPB04713.1 hypothetical protein RHO25_009360 [Cercospora beticola]